MADIYDLRLTRDFSIVYGLQWISQFILSEPSYDYSGTFVNEDETEYDNIIWNDVRVKPTWTEVVDAYNTYNTVFYPTLNVTHASFNNIIQVVIDSKLATADLASKVEGIISLAVNTSLDGKVDKVSGKGLSSEDFTPSEKSKLSGVESQATKNSSDSFLLSRGNHTGTQNISTISGLQSSLDSKMINLGSANQAVKTYSGTTDSNGNVVFNLTSDNTSSGSALFSSISAAIPTSYDGSGVATQAPNAFNVSWTNSGKTLTVRVNRGTSTSVLIGGTIHSDQFAGAGYFVELIVIGTKA